MVYIPFHPKNAASFEMDLTATSGASVLALSYDTGMDAVRFTNVGTGIAFVRLTSLQSEATAVLTDMPILSSTSVVINGSGTTGYVAGVTKAGSTAVIFVTPGWQK